MFICGRNSVFMWYKSILSSCSQRGPGTQKFNTLGLLAHDGNFGREEWRGWNPKWAGGIVRVQALPYIKVQGMWNPGNGTEQCGWWH